MSERLEHFSRQHFERGILFFQENMFLYCLFWLQFSYKDSFHIYVLGKIRKNINWSSAEFANRVVMVKVETGWQIEQTWPRGYKTFFMLNSAEHEIFSAYKYENANKSWHFHIY